MLPIYERGKKKEVQMFLTVSPINVNSKNYKQNFGAFIPKNVAMVIAKKERCPKELENDFFEACMDIAGPETFYKGTAGVLAKCADAIRAQFPDLLTRPEQYGKGIDIKPVYNETPEAKYAIETAKKYRNMTGAESLRFEEFKLPIIPN